MNAQTFPLSADQRSALRKAIVAHDGWSDYRASAGVTSDSMTVGDLFAAAAALGVDVATITGATAAGEDMSDEHHKPRPHDNTAVVALQARFIAAFDNINSKDNHFCADVFRTIDSKQDGRATDRQFSVLNKIITRAEKKAGEAKSSGGMFGMFAQHGNQEQKPATVPAPAPVTVTTPGAMGDAASQLASLIAQMAGQSINPETVARIVDERITAALAGIPSVKIECKGVDGQWRDVSGHQHPQFKRLLKAASSRMASGYAPSIWIAGPAGSGKTHAGHMLADALGLPFHLHGATAMAHELLGFIDAAGNYHRTPFREAFEHGGVVMLDEVDAYENPALLALNAALANGAATFPDAAIKRHRDCIIIGSANTWGLGATAEYVGRSKIDAAFLSRFPVRLQWDYDTALEVAISGNEDFARRVIAARERARQAGLKVLIDPRASQAGAALVASGFTSDEAAELTYLANLTADQRRIVEAR